MSQEMQAIGVGQELPSLVKEEITHVQLVKYAGASGDFNPIHTVVPIGEKAGLGGVIAHGMLIMGFAGQAITTWFPRKNLRRFKVRFVAMTRPGEEITVNGKVMERITVGGESRLLCEVMAQNSNGEVKLKGEFEVAEEEKGQ
ncbi:MaoC/PaaZ C-terminal domain-containing protein [Effusibacillus lacus]|uniref:3-hydroxyacyl-ACP dehydratase n=1 Tax=Effusibacillus lacus TaxID=1348429 RepID=A0A292YIB2_9BACL|nr:MaoC/PaaZ C-terminal domain-containing protein [Effusibacillus lacus]TCS74569.1 acyl dehydratase [Effusibacillus lacus]GAX88443.1 3-hydroxyacyl-ACP dehydratase [Effusibacillus lacus]